jgi:tetratricopeptide (TPR) repeat protein
MKHSALALAIVATSRFVLAEPASDPAALFHQGQAAYDQQRYDEALTAWEQSYALSLSPALLYNIAQAYRLRGHAEDCALARADYAKFIELAPPSPERDLAARYVAELAVCSSPADAAKAATIPVAPNSTDAPTSDAAAGSPQPPTARSLANIGGVALGVAGFGLLASGIALGHHASVLGDDVTQACSVSCTWSAETTRDAAGRRDAAVGWALDGVGAAALVGSAVLLYFGFNERGIAVVPTSSTGASVVWSRVW